MSRVTSLVLLVVSWAATSCAQDVLYDNGPDPGNIYGWAICDGHEVANSFELSADSTVTAIDVSLYDVNELNVPETLSWQITDAPEGNTLAYGDAASLRKIDGPHVNYFLFQQWTMEFEIAHVKLQAGRYWLRLSDATNRWQTGTFWGENNGPSLAFFTGALGGYWKHGGHDEGGSESFRVLGSRQ